MPDTPRKAYTKHLSFFAAPAVSERVEALRHRGIAPGAPTPDRSSVLRYILDKGLAAIEGESAPGPVST